MTKPGSSLNSTLSSMREILSDQSIGRNASTARRRKLGAGHGITESQLSKPGDFTQVSLAGYLSVTGIFHQLQGHSRCLTKPSLVKKPEAQAATEDEHHLLECRSRLTSSIARKAKPGPSRPLHLRPFQEHTSRIWTVTRAVRPGIRQSLTPQWRDSQGTRISSA